MIIPNASNHKALFIIDVQPQTCRGDIPKSVIRDIVKYVGQSSYDAYVVAEYHAPAGTMFDKQHDFILTKDETGTTCEDILEAISASAYKDDIFRVSKRTRSCFKGNDPKGLRAFLNDRHIEEIHFVGFDINDCVLASAYDAIDFGYYSFVLEELCHHNSGLENLKSAALEIFHSQSMTNNSLHKKINRTEIDF